VEREWRENRSMAEGEEWREEPREPRGAKHALVQDRYKRTGEKCLAAKKTEGGIYAVGDNLGSWRRCRRRCRS
jgi:hypothetical protein